MSEADDGNDPSGVQPSNPSPPPEPTAHTLSDEPVAAPVSADEMRARRLAVTLLILFISILAHFRLSADLEKVRQHLPTLLLTHLPHQYQHLPRVPFLLLLLLFLLVPPCKTIPFGAPHFQSQRSLSQLIIPPLLSLLPQSRTCRSLRRSPSFRLFNGNRRCYDQYLKYPWIRTYTLFFPSCLLTHFCCFYYVGVANRSFPLPLRSWQTPPLFSPFCH